MSERVGSQPAETPDPGGGNRGNVNNRNGNGRNNNNGNNNNNRREQDHEGRTEALKGYMFRIRAQHPWESFARTCREIGEHIGRQILPTAGEFRIALQTLTLPPLVEPPEPAGTAGPNPGDDEIPPTSYAIKRWEIAYRTFENDRTQRDLNQQTVFPIILGQCTIELRSRLESDPDYAIISSTSDVMGLLTLIQARAFISLTEGDYVYNMFQVETAWRNFKQPRNMDLGDFLHTFQDCLANYERLVGEIGSDMLRIRLYLQYEMRIDPNLANVMQINQARAGAREAYIAVVFLENANRSLYSGVLEQLRVNFLLNQAGYPRTLLAAYNLLANSQAGNGNQNNNRSQHDVQPMFLREADGGGNGGGAGANCGGRGRGNGSNGGRTSGGGQRPQNSQSTDSSSSNNSRYGRRHEMGNKHFRLLEDAS